MDYITIIDSYSQNLICYYFQPPLNEPEYIDITGDNNPYGPSYEDYNTSIEDLAPETDAPTSSYGNPGAVITKVNISCFTASHTELLRDRTMDNHLRFTSNDDILFQNLETDSFNQPIKIFKSIKVLSQQIMEFFLK